MVIRTRNILSLCAGVGGLELGILLALHHRGEAGRGICYVEREGAAAASLVASMEAGWFHPAPIWSDMLTFDPRPWRGSVHILASGDPCQDNSVAGKRAGSEGERFLAPEVVRIAEGCRPDLIFRENVPGNAGEQLAVLAPALERLGYRVAAGIFSSAETGNTMRRERLFIMARAAEPSEGRRGIFGPDEGAAETGRGGSPAQPVRGGDYVGGTPSARPLPAALAGTDRGEEGRGTRDAEPQRRGGELGSTDGADPQGQRADDNAIGREDAGRSTGLSGRAVLPPSVIPGPSDARWADVLAHWPELQPALSEAETQSLLRRGTDAMAHRIERLRATGNGVDPVVAAYAFLSLGALLDEGRGTGKPVLMEVA